ncbi:MAG TPA: hypothetical protein VKU37_12455 [Verrucomicrobiae bacterium]|nr:hypothetical protein [Verrucomicrobiae bacterium]
MSAIPVASHRFRALFGTDASRIFRVSFRGGDVFRLRSLSAVDPSIYSISDQWTAEVVERISGQRLLHSGSGLDFVESDIVEIYDESSEKIVYKGEHAA